MKEVSTKKTILSSLLMAVEVNEKYINSEGHEDIYFTYVTANGLVTGKKVDYDKWDIDSDKDISETLLKVYREKGEINFFSLADAIARKNTEQSKEDLIIKDHENYIVLEDVILDKQDGLNPITINYFVLFLDQVIGIIPGKKN
ncbi:hypothetical protein [Bacillus toyonensis]